MSFENHKERPIRYTPAVWLATGFGIGLVSPAPGTVGALVWGMPLAWAICLLPQWWMEVCALVLLNLIGISLCTTAGRDLGGKKDNQAIVWDEIATVPMAFFVIPFTDWRSGLLGFALIRVFDILKPPPARQLERWADGLGVMADDWVAGVHAMVAMALIYQIWPA